MFCFVVSAVHIYDTRWKLIYCIVACHNTLKTKIQGKMNGHKLSEGAICVFSKLFFVIVKVAKYRNGSFFYNIS